MQYWIYYSAIILTVNILDLKSNIKLKCFLNLSYMNSSGLVQNVYNFGAF